MYLSFNGIPPLVKRTELSQHWQVVCFLVPAKKVPWFIMPVLSVSTVLAPGCERIGTIHFMAPLQLHWLLLLPTGISQLAWPGSPFHGANPPWHPCIQRSLYRHRTKTGTVGKFTFHSPEAIPQSITTRNRRKENTSLM